MKITILFLLLATSCSQSTNSTSKKLLEVNFYQELPLCDSNYNLIRAFVKSENKVYICSGNKWQEDPI